MDARRQFVEDVFRAAVQAVDPEQAVYRHLSRVGATLRIGTRSYDLARYRRVLLMGAGKGTAPMARALETILGDRIDVGLIVVKYGHGLPLKHTRVFEAAHPVPDRTGIEATRLMFEQVQSCASDDLILFAFSGGGSALMPAPRKPLEMADKQLTTRLLLECGATIDEINAIRKHLSFVKGGGLARAAHPATVVSLILSDVVGDPLDVIASGPTAPDPSSFEECLRIVGRYQLEQRLPPEVMGVLREGAAGRLPETPKPGDAVFEGVYNLIVGNNRAALAAGRERAAADGLKTMILTSELQGEAREVAAVLAAVGKEVVRSGNPVAAPACILAGGETTVTIRGGGKGGRNQELALAAAIAMDGWDRLALLSAGTDGTDGPTDAAGAFVTGATCREARRAGLDPHEYLARNDAYTFFHQMGGLLVTGPTRTNVMDVICLVVTGPDGDPGGAAVGPGTHKEGAS